MDVNHIESRCICKASVLHTNKQVLIVEDDPFSRNLISQTITENFANLEIDFSDNYLDAQRRIDSNFHYNLMIIDALLNHTLSGLTLYRRVLESKPTTTVVMTSSLSKDEVLKYFAEEIPVPAFIKKPFHTTALVELIGSLEEGNTL